MPGCVLEEQLGKVTKEDLALQSRPGGEVEAYA